ncbi:MAG: type III pantothenate kinase [Ignavibacteria bacterium]|nr:type III pantothenate kinase [Ignavibacteria bacterium]
MNNLLIDIGNSDVKVGVGRPGILEIKFNGRFSYSKRNFKKDLTVNFDKLNLTKKTFINIGISALKDADNNYLNKFFQSEFNLKPVFVSRDMSLPIKINYSAGLGNDRICNAVAAVRMYGKNNILIIDFGTATTYTMVSGKVLTGGMISPGDKDFPSFIN